MAERPPRVLVLKEDGPDDIYSPQTNVQEAEERGIVEFRTRELREELRETVEDDEYRFERLAEDVERKRQIEGGRPQRRAKGIKNRFKEIVTPSFVRNERLEGENGDIYSFQLEYHLRWKGLKRYPIPDVYQQGLTPNKPFEGYDSRGFLTITFDEGKIDTVAMTFETGTIYNNDWSTDSTFPRYEKEFPPALWGCVRRPVWESSRTWEASFLLNKPAFVLVSVGEPEHDNRRYIYNGVRERFVKDTVVGSGSIGKSEYLEAMQEVLQLVPAHND